MKKYLINEIFYSLQGEGRYTGTPAVFIRFAGCNLRCPFCDTNFHAGEKMTAEEIKDRCVALVPQNQNRPMLVLTGGEPTLQVDRMLMDILWPEFPIVAMETNGSKIVPTGVDFVTCSPKCDFVGDYPVIGNADEVKVVFDGKNQEAVLKWQARIRATDYYIQPCDTGDPAKNEEIRQAAVEFCLTHPEWKLSLQTQKILNVR